MKRIINILSWLSPFIVAVFTVTSLYAENAQRLDPGQMVIPLIFGLFIAGLFLLLFWLLKWTEKAALFVASIFTGAFLLFHISVWGFVIAMAGALIMGVMGKKHTLPATVILAVICGVGIVITAIQGLTIHVSDTVKMEQTYTYIPGKPNIYFIVPDRMPSSAAMRESGIVPDAEIRELTSLGFYVPADMRSHDEYTPDYPDKVYTTRTMRYFASALNEGQEIPLTIPYKDCRALIKNPVLFDLLHNKGYKITNIASWFNETSNFPGVDENLKFARVSLQERLFADELSVAYFERTILAGLNFRILETDIAQAKVEMARHDWQAGTISGKASLGPVSNFVITHIMLPHEPFIYTDSRDTKEQYIDQIKYALRYITDLAADIRALDPTAIVIVQADEGMAFRKPAELNKELSLVQWSGVFTAWYIPGADENKLSTLQHTEILKYVVGGVE